MVHNGIEYGIMAAYAEGLNILHHANVGKHQQEIDAETSPLRNPEYYQYDLNLPDVAELWRRGSVIGSWLLDLTADALLKSPDLANFHGRVSDSGEGRWTITAAIDESVPVPVLSSALFERFSSRGEADYADKLLSAMRFEFGGHLEKDDVFVNDIGGQFRIRIGARDSFERVTAKQIWGPCDNEKGNHLAFDNEKGSHLWHISTSPCSNGVAQTVPESFLPRRCRGSPLSVACPTSAAARYRVPDSRCGLLFQSHAKSRPRRRRGDRVRARSSWP
jgi:hypothetical protein